MRIGLVTLKNYGSYKDLEFDYSNLGLALVSGMTKSGKSTILDAAGWIIFGCTSKELNADDVKSWFSEEETSGTVRVDLPGQSVFITRTRGKRAAQNDLFFYVERDAQHGPSTPVRGKDANDTQRMICEVIGVTADLYFAASYLHQFSSDKFFTAKAKDRRESMEKIADMSLAINLGQRASDKRKEAKRDLENKQLSKSRLESKVETLKGTVAEQVQSKARWEERKKYDLAALQTKSDNFESDKEERVYKLVGQLEQLDSLIKPDQVYIERQAQLRAQIKAIEPLEESLKKINYQVAEAETEAKALTATLDSAQDEEMSCPTCDREYDNADPDAHLARLKALTVALDERLGKVAEVKAEARRLSEAVSVKTKLMDGLTKCTTERQANKNLIERFESIQAQALSLREELNPYGDQLETARAQVNPYGEEIEGTKQKITATEKELKAVLDEVEALEHKISSLTWLYDKSYELRGLFLSRSVSQINETTNRILERYFDATIRVEFTLADSDKLEVFITNEGYEAKYAQLSGGERCMLKLAFSIGYMKAAENTAGIKFDNLMLDEAMNGLDGSLKVKAFALLQELEKEYGTVLLIDHSEELKSLFNTRFTVTKNGAYSSVSSDSI